uniref:Uncharacterized protein n=1 Tax=uncultured nuHF2 cluster bacterium HF0770_42C12 TaxID=723593 RepID=E7C804_9BACT|nr:hypothetical protein [uncultured nuHF2 cluster bacterium HF0770_42C12]
MICPDCEKGVVLILRAQKKEEMRPYKGTMFLANPEKYFDKAPCRRCNGSGIAYCCDGEDASQPDFSAGDTASTGEAQPLVA